MTMRIPIPQDVLRELRDDEAGATLVEFALTVSLLLLLFFGLIDFGRLSYHWIGAEKATHLAARIAAVRPAICAGVPDTYVRGSDLTVRFGTNCRSGQGVCSPVATVSCSGTAGHPVVAEIWNRIEPLLPNSASPSNLMFRYSYDPALGFLGGPYIPLVTVELGPDATGAPLQFEFATPLAALGALASGTAPTGSGYMGPITFPTMSVSLPGEDLAVGGAG